jgi:hypothetical protein
VGNSTASGYGSIALLNADASGAESVAIGRTVFASGQWAVALGSGETSAIGNLSIALGFANEAFGDLSAAMGDHTRAYGYTSTSMGAYTSASGDYSTSIGFRTEASDYNSLVVGRYNLLGSTVTNSATAFSTDNTAFVIGNGADANNRSDALTVLFDGTTNVAGSVTATSFIGDGSQLTNLTSNSPFSYNTNNEGGIEIADYTTASGSRAFAVGNDNSASGSSSTALGRGTIAIGDVSISMGFDTTASGSSSTAMGVNTTASGNISTAIGAGTTATGDVSTAMGIETTASGTASTAMGYQTIASDYGSLVIGQHNSSGSSVTNADLFSTSAPAFVIGNGTNADNRSDALTVLFDGTTNVAGSVTATEFIGDGSQLTNLPSSSPFSYNETSGGGIQSSSNIASGYASTAYGNYTTASGTYSKATGDRTVASGEASIAMGNRTIASGDYSTAIGNRTKASGVYSTAMGYQTTASGTSSTAMGAFTTASGVYSTAMGYQTTASGSFSTALGDRTVASGINSIVLGVLTEASGDYSTAMGTSTTANGDYSTAMGTSTTANGDYSTAMGASTTAEDYLSLAIGVLNKTDESPNPNSFSYQNTAFVIGNGGHDSEGNYVGTSETFSNAFEVLFDGTTTIAGDLSINSDARLKANIISLGSTLAKLLQIDGKTYTMKKDENKKQKIGVLAQDIEKVFPELVSESNGVKSVNYQGLVPVLINALKEQQAEIDRLKTQEERLDRLERLVAAMD